MFDKLNNIFYQLINSRYYYILYILMVFGKNIYNFNLIHTKIYTEV